MSSELLSKAIAATIRDAGGAIPFARFMELALYHPQFGYYTRPGATPVGKHGDFITSVSLGPLFGRILARQVHDFRATLGSPADFIVVEYGAHRGDLRTHIVEALPHVSYRTIDVGDPAPDTFTGCVLANEFLDALPVHRVRAIDGEWRELYVAARAEGFCEQPGPLSTSRLQDALNGLPVALMEGVTTEINLRVLDWIDNLAQRLTRGFVLIADYGFERHEFFAPQHAQGTLACYRKHQRGDDPFHHIGEQDITAHVEFSALMEHAARRGFQIETFMDQGRFLLKVGEPLIRALVEQEAGRVSALRGTLNQLTHPSLMGQAFKVLVLRRG